SSSDAGQPTDSATRLQVTGELPATAALADAIPILLSEYHFDLPASLVAGPQIWQLTNTGAQPHFLGLVELPEGTTTGQLTEFLDMALTGTPAVSALGFDDVQDVYSSVIFSAGQTTWIEVDLTPGTYGVACLVSDRYSQAPHATLGMIQVFTVQ
ncbi:MAG TPA: hypothetical protein VFP05_13580, partial [Thermomicrobiales bacterium]|nr:hypothetical protein [Thermomicrobiales bacterium]